MLPDRIKYVSIILFLSLFFYQGISRAQLTGTKTIPGDYATVEAAITDLNAQGVGSGGVTFNVAAGHTETFSDPLVGTITATGTQTDQIIFQKSGGGANPLITAALNPSFSNDITASIVVPPAEQTISFSSPGCFKLS